MRKSHEIVCKAFLFGKTAKVGNLHTADNKLFLFGNLIAEKNGLGVTVTPFWQGKVTYTTKAVVNALCELSGTDWRLYHERNQPLWGDGKTKIVAEECHSI